MWKDWYSVNKLILLKLERGQPLLHCALWVFHPGYESTVWNPIYGVTARLVRDFIAFQTHHTRLQQSCCPIIFWIMSFQNGVWPSPTASFLIWPRHSIPVYVKISRTEYLVLLPGNHKIIWKWNEITWKREVGWNVRNVDRNSKIERISRGKKKKKKSLLCLP